MSDASEGDALITAEVREKIAKTIYDFDRRHSAIVPWEENYESAKKRWREYADAALSALPAIIRQAREDERKRCAEVADNHAFDNDNADQANFGYRIAAAIRSTEPSP